MHQTNASSLSSYFEWMNGSVSSSKVVHHTQNRSKQPLGKQPPTTTGNRTKPRQIAGEREREREKDYVWVYVPRSLCCIRSTRRYRSPEGPSNSLVFWSQTQQILVQRPCSYIEEALAELAEASPPTKVKDQIWPRPLTLPQSRALSSSFTPWVARSLLPPPPSLLFSSSSSSSLFFFVLEMKFHEMKKFPAENFSVFEKLEREKNN